MEEEDKIPKVFISYSHDSPEHKKWVAEFYDTKKLTPELLNSKQWQDSLKESRECLESLKKKNTDVSVQTKQTQGHKRSENIEKLLERLKAEGKLVEETKCSTAVSIAIDKKE